jgi:hypothetical protein
MKTELGLVDEAKQAVEKWMARWIEVVRQFNLVERNITDISGYSKRLYTLLPGLKTFKWNIR